MCDVCVVERVGGGVGVIRVWWRGLVCGGCDACVVERVGCGVGVMCVWWRGLMCGVCAGKGGMLVKDEGFNGRKVPLRSGCFGSIAGFDMFEKEVEVDGEKVKMYLW